MIDLIIAIIISYFIGSFPTAILAGKILKKIDIREHGSGNAGATNVFRILGWKSGLIVLGIDMFKGFAPVWWLVPVQSNPDLTALYQILIGISAICGHIWTIFAGFKGGKGVGTAAGVFLALQPLPVLFSLVTFIMIVSKTKYVSLGSMVAASMLPVFILIKKYVFQYPVSNIVIVVSIILASLIVFMHRENISRLMAGNENKLSFSKKEKAN
jgi:acyl phosphate:glycerol-3-phosphate acyltransferase